MKKIIGYSFLTVVLALSMFTGCTPEPANNNPVGTDTTTTDSAMRNNTAINRSSASNYDSIYNRSYENYNGLYSDYNSKGYNTNAYGLNNYNSIIGNRTLTNGGITVKSNLNNTTTRSDTNNTIGTPYTNLR